MKIAIQGHSTRKKEVIQLLESLGGVNKWDQTGGRISCAYYIDHANNIYSFGICGYCGDRKIYTLEEFETQFPFKIGDLCVYQSEHNGDIVVKVLGITIQDNNIVYEIGPKDTDKTYSGIYRKRETLKPYKEMKKERNVVLTLEKAKEWYNKGGELKEIALQAFTERELNPLPKSWNEFCETHPIKKEESYITNWGEIFTYACSSTRLCPNVCPSEDSAIAHLAMIQLEQLRDCYRGLFVTVTGMPVWCIMRRNGGLVISPRTWGMDETFLSFQSHELAGEFLKNFNSLIEQAGDLI